MILNEIRGFGPSGVFLLLDKTAQTFHISYTTNFKYYIGWVLDVIREAPANSDLELLELSKSSDIETLKLHTEYWIDQYRNMGYKEFQSRGRKAVQYRVRVLVAPKYKGFDVQLVSKRGTKIITVGRFPNRYEAEDFVSIYYGEDNRYNFPVYAINSLTRELLSMTGERGIVEY